MRSLHGNNPLFIAVLLCVAGLLTGWNGVRPACAQLSSGEVGLFLDPAAELSWGQMKSEFR